MLVVVFYHCICAYGVWSNPAYSVAQHVPIWDILYDIMRNIHMPMFFILAGYLFGYKRHVGGYNDFRKFVKNKFSRVMAPYFLVGFIIVFIQNEPIINMFSGISHLWFLMTIFECYIVGRLIDGILRIQNKYKLFVLTLCVFLVCIQGRFSIHIDELTVRLFCGYFPVYMIGMILGTFNLSCIKLVRFEFVSAIVSFSIMLFLACFLKIDGLLRIFGLFFVVSIFMLMRNYSKIRISRPIKSLDKCSMGIYIVHHILIQEMNRLSLFHSMMEEYYVLYPLIQFLVVVSICWFVVLNLKKRYAWAKYLVG